MRFAAPMVYHATSLRFEKYSLQTADVALAKVFHALSWRDARSADSKLRISLVFDAVSLRNTRNSVSELRIARCQLYSRNFKEIRETSPPNCGPDVAAGISRNIIEQYEKRRLQTVDFTLPIVFHAI